MIKRLGAFSQGKEMTFTRFWALFFAHLLPLRIFIGFQLPLLR